MTAVSVSEGEEWVAEASVAGRPCWYELGTTDLVGAGDFYRQVMDWTVTAPMVTEVPYLVAVVDERAIAGFMLTAAQIGAPPPGWIPYFATADCAATAAAARRWRARRTRGTRA